MSPTYEQQDVDGRLVPATHDVRLSDAGEIVEAVNRRRRLVYQSPTDYSGNIDAGLPVRRSTFAGSVSDSPIPIRPNIEEVIVEPEAETLGGTPPSPESMQWLWPVPDSDEGKVIVAGSASAGEISLFDSLNGTDTWTDPGLPSPATSIRATHLNEYRQAMEWLVRGRWTLPIYFSAGLFSIMPDTPWLGEAIANNGTDELRSVGFVLLRNGESGVRDATIRSSSRIEITADTDCTIELYHCLRSLEYVADPPTWNQYDPSEGHNWSSAGGTGSSDVDVLGTLAVAAGMPSSLSNSAVQAAFQAMVDGAEQNILARRLDTVNETISITGRVIVDFDLDSPPI